MVIGQVQCVGNESSLVDCPHLKKPHDQVSSCDPSQVAAVSCHGMLKLLKKYSLVWTHNPLDAATEFADCRTGDVRLTNFSDNSEEDSQQGTIQICVNNAWGSVCSDHFFDNTDAAVFCGQLPGFKANGMKLNINSINV